MIIVVHFYLGFSLRHSYDATCDNDNDCDQFKSEGVLSNWARDMLNIKLIAEDPFQMKSVS